MNFIRPELRAVLWRWREVGVGLGLLGLGIYWFLTSFGFLQFVGLIIGFIGVSVVLAGVQRARVTQRSGGGGVIELDERRLTFLNAEGGLVIDLPSVSRIEIETTGQGPYEDDLFWCFYQNNGHQARIPASAVGSELLFDALASFPGADYEKVIAASGSTTENVFVIWQKDRRALH